MSGNKINKDKQKTVQNVSAITDEIAQLQKKYAMEKQIFVAKEKELYNKKRKLLLKFVKETAKFKIGDYFTNNNKGIYIKEITTNKYISYNKTPKNEFEPYYHLCNLSATGKELDTHYGNISESRLLNALKHGKYHKIDKEKEDMYFIPSFIVFQELSIKDDTEWTLTVLGITKQGRSYLFTVARIYKKEVEKAINCTDNSYRLFINKPTKSNEYSFGQRVPEPFNKSGYRDNRLGMVHEITLFKTATDLLEHIL